MSHLISPNWFDQTPDSAYLREWQLIGDSKDPTSPRLLPISRASLWRMVKAGRFPPLVDVNYPDRSATTILAGGSGE